MKLEKRADGWWITVTEPGMEDMGPYTSRQEAQTDKIGVERTMRADRDNHVKKPTTRKPRVLK